MKSQKKKFINVLFIFLIIMGIIFYIITSLKRINYKFKNQFSNITKVSQKACYKRTGCFLGLGNLSHDYCYKKVNFCKKIEYRGIKNGNYYTYFVIDRGIKKIILEDFSSQERYFPIANKIIEELGLSSEIKDMYVSGVPDYSEKGNEFKVDGNIAQIVIYLDQKLKDIINEDTFNKYILINNYLNEKKSGVMVYIQYEDNYKIEFGYPWLELYKDDMLILDSNGRYEINNYDEFMQKLHN